MSSVTFHEPSDCFFHTATYLPFSVPPAIVTSYEPVVYAISPLFATSALSGVHERENPGALLISSYLVRIVAAPFCAGSPGAYTVASCAMKDMNLSGSFVLWAHSRSRASTALRSRSRFTERAHPAAANASINTHICRLCRRMCLPPYEFPRTLP